MTPAKPITARECADAGMMLRVMCRCGHESRMEPELVAFMLGEDFPLATGLAALSWSINCGACNNPRPVIVFADEAEEVEQALEFVLSRPSRRLAVGR